MRETPQPQRQGVGGLLLSPLSSSPPATVPLPAAGLGAAGLDGAGSALHELAPKSACFRFSRGTEVVLFLQTASKLPLE